MQKETVSERERERGREKQTDRRTDKDRQTHTHTQTDTQKQKQRHADGRRHIHRYYLMVLECKHLIKIPAVSVGEI